MTVVAAVLVVPLVVDTIAAHRAELENIISKASESLSKKTARRLASGFDRKSGSQAVSATTLQDAVLRWEEKLHDTSKASTAVQQHVLMTCIIDAAAENVRTRLPEGLLPRASVSAIRQMLLSFYGTLTQQTQVGASCCSALPVTTHLQWSVKAREFWVQEDGADQDTQHTASHTEKSVVARRDRFANSSHYRQMTVIFHQAESHWQQLLL